ncbi:MAG: hypothetical protein KDC24_07200, partial [Saprospiraceae bacterium]|nr:hypothetical protein [Saprospiraceae bacterium]
MMTPVKIFLLVLLGSFGLQAQVCYPTDEPPGPYVCWPLIDGYTASTEGFTADSPFENFCGTIENNSWFSISPCGTTVVLAIESSGCFMGFGVQAALYDQAFNLVSTCYSSMGNDFEGQMAANNLTPGNIYYVMVDGFLGDECIYTITALEGISPPSSEVITETTEGSIQGRSMVCNGELVPYQVTPPSCVHESNTGSSCPLPNLSAYYDTTYYWSLPEGAQIIGNANTASANIFFGENFEGGTVSVSMEIHSLIGGCDEVTCASGFGVGTCTDIINDFYIDIKDPFTYILPPVQICSGECYDFRGNTYCNEGRYEIEVEVPLDCDSILVFDLSIKDETLEDLGVLHLCGQECYKVDGQFFCDEGYFEVPLSSKDGCDSLVIFEIQKHSTYNQNLGIVSICENTCFEFDGIDYCQSGRYTRHYTSKYGCDSTIRFEVRVVAEMTETLPTQFTCKGDCITINGSQYYQEGSFSFITLSKDGCDSIVNFEIKYLPSDTVDLGVIPVCEANCFEINGQQYCDPGNYNQVYQNKNGCDSTVQFRIEKRDFEFSIEHPSLLQAGDSSAVRLSSTLQGNTNHLTYSWSGPGITQANASEENPQITIPGIYQLVITDTLTGCEKRQEIEVKQNQTVCIGSTVELSGVCDTAPFLCGNTLQGYCSATDMVDPNPQPLPGNLAQVLSAPLENPRWATWSPCEEDVTLRLVTFNCLQNQGTEWSVLASDNCQDFTVVIDSKGLENETIEDVLLTDLEPGKTYLFIWDGKDGDVCDFQIEVINGISTEPAEWSELAPGIILGANNLCPGSVQTYNFTDPVYLLKNGNCYIGSDI